MLLQSGLHISHMQTLSTVRCLMPVHSRIPILELSILRSWVNKPLTEMLPLATCFLWGQIWLTTSSLAVSKGPTFSSTIKTTTLRRRIRLSLRILGVQFLCCKRLKALKSKMLVLFLNKLDQSMKSKFLKIK